MPGFSGHTIDARMAKKFGEVGRGASLMHRPWVHGTASEPPGEKVQQSDGSAVAAQDFDKLHAEKIGESALTNKRVMPHTNPYTCPYNGCLPGGVPQLLTGLPANR